MAPLVYRPSDWYWFIGGDTSQVWSSARALLVPASDADYLAWLEGGSQPSNAATMADVEASLALVFPRGTPRTYASNCRYNKQNGGVIVTSLSPVPFASDPVSGNAVNTAWDYMNAKGTLNQISWKLTDGSFVQLTTAQMNTLNSAMVVFVQACFEAEGGLQPSINDGTATLAQIDDAFAAISNVYP